MAVSQLHSAMQLLVQYDTQLSIWCQFMSIQWWMKYRFWI